MKRHFFLIDDDEDELDIFMEAIRQVNIPTKCTYAQSAEQALDMLNYLAPDYIFVDINMPKANGYDCLMKIKAKPGLESSCIVMYSNGIDDKSAAKAIMLGATHCIHKTENISDLVREIRQLIETREQHVSSAEMNKN
jgi:DNA-binding NtrC family response regulator